jgi:trk system potassium uptake protein TrkA
MSQRAIIAGGGRIGARTATILGNYGYDPVVIEEDSHRCNQLEQSRHGVIIEGNAMRPSILSQAAPERADVFAALTGTDATNRMLCQRIERLTGDITTVARRTESSADSAEADSVVRPAVAGAKAAAGAILDWGHQLHEFPAGGFDIVEFAVDPRAPVAGKQLTDVRLPPNSDVIGNTATMDVASPETQFQPGDSYLVAVEPGAAAEIRKLMRG